MRGIRARYRMVVYGKEIVTPTSREPARRASETRHRLLLGACLLTVAVVTGARLELIVARGQYPLHGDEQVVNDTAWHMVAKTTLRPGFYNYGSLPMYVAGAAMGSAAVIAGVDPASVQSVAFPYYAPPPIPQAARVVFLLVAGLGLLAAGVAASSAFDRDALLVLAPATLAASSLYLRQSWVSVNVDAFAAAIVLIATAYAFRTLDATDVRRRIVVPALLCGAVTATKYNSALLCIPFAILIVRAGRLAQVVARLAAFGVLCVASFLLFEPYAVLDYKNFAEDVTSEIAHYRRGHPGNDGDAGVAQLAFYVRELARDYGAVLFGLGLVGMARALRARPLQALLLMSFPVAMLLHMSTNRVNFVRSVLPVFALYAIFIAYGALTLVDVGRWAFMRIARGVRSESMRARVASVGAWCLAALLVGIGGGITRVVAAHRPIVDSRIVVAEWLAENAPRRCLVLVPKQLAFDAGSLPGRCRSSVFDVDATALARALTTEAAAAGDGETRFLLWARFGYDPRDPAGAARADAWNAMPANSGLDRVLWHGGEQEVLVNYETIERGDPGLMLYVVPTD